MNVSIIIPNWNGQSLFEKNLSSILLAKKNKKNRISEVIIVDDASSDGSVAYLKKNFINEIKLVVHTINRGFAASVNTGVRSAKGEFVVLLNTDIIVSEDFLETSLRDFSEDQTIFAVSLHEKGYGASQGKFQNGFIVHQGLHEEKEKKLTFWANGGSAIFRKKIWKELHGMDEELYTPFYWEDIDISYRAQKRGYRILWEPDANVIHEHEATMKKLPQKRVQQVRERNYLLFNWKNITSPTLTRKHISGLIKRIMRHPGYIKVVISALSKYKTMKRLRLREKKEASVSDEAVFARFN